MKAVILAGGRGTRLSEETGSRPKPMVELGNMPILWHIMKIYAAHGVQEFVICLGYKGMMIKEFFLNYPWRTSDLTIDLTSGDVTVENRRTEPWRVTLVDTGLNTHTGGRLRRIRQHVAKDPFFLMTYGDGLADIDVTASVEHHLRQQRLATMAVVRPPARFGSARVEDGRVQHFIEKSQADEGYINGGFFVLSPQALDFIEGDSTSWEFDSLPRIAGQEQLAAYEHGGFWQPMDTLRDKEYLQGLIDAGEAPWITWDRSAGVPARA